MCAGVLLSLDALEKQGICVNGIQAPGNYVFVFCIFYLFFIFLEHLPNHMEEADAANPK